MNLSKKLSWRAAAVAAAVMVAGVAQADHRGGGHRDHGRDRGDHQRVWRDHGHHYYGYNNRGYSRYSSRHYDYRPHYRQYGYSAGWPTYYRSYSYGPSLTFEIPLY